MTFKVTILIIQGLHAVQNQSNNNLLCSYLILPLKVFVAPINPAWLTAPGSPRMEFVLDEQQFQELSPLVNGLFKDFSGTEFKF